MQNKDLFEEIVNYKNINQRNNIILDLAEQQDPTAYQVILCLIDNAEERTRGTLVYALHYYPPEPLFNKAIDWVLNNNFEVAHEAFELLNLIDEINGDQVEEAYKTISKSLKNNNIEDWRRNLLSDLLEMIS